MVKKIITSIVLAARNNHSLPPPKVYPLRHEHQLIGRKYAPRPHLPKTCYHKPSRSSPRQDQATKGKPDTSGPLPCSPDTDPVDTQSAQASHARPSHSKCGRCGNPTPPLTHRAKTHDASSLGATNLSTPPISSPPQISAQQCTPRTPQ